MKKLLKKKHNRITAFTLAETLIVLAIIGVVAAITIPSLVGNYQKQQYRSALKKAYATTSSAVDQMRQDEGGSFKDYEYNLGSFKPVFMKYLKILKDCGLAGCVPVAANSTIYSSFTGIPVDTGWGGEGQFITADGTFYNIQNSAVSTISILVDVNGYQKGPNRYGIDMFEFDIVNDKLLPSGAIGTYHQNTTFYCSKTDSGTRNGLGCTIFAVKDEDY